MSLLQSKPAVLMTFRKEEGTAIGRFLGCLLSDAREGTDSLHSREGEESFGSNRLVSSTQTGNDEELGFVALLLE